MMEEPYNTSWQFWVADSVTSLQSCILFCYFELLYVHFAFKF